MGDRHNHAVRMIDRETGIIDTIVGNRTINDEERNDPEERNPLRLNLPKISSMDYYGGRLLIPTDLEEDSGDLVVLRKTRRDSPD